MGRCIVYIRIRLLLHIHPFISSFFFLSNFQTLKFLSHFSQELWGLEGWNLVHMWTVDRCIVYTGIRLLLLTHPFIFHFSFSPIFKHENFSSHFSQELWGLEGWNLLYMWKMGGCTAYTGIMLLLLFVPLFFIFLSSFQTLKIFVILFSGTIIPRRLKLGTHVDSEQMYCVYRKPAAAACSSLHFFIFLSLQFSDIEIFRQSFLRNCEA